jgi:hypothetical protein
VAEHDGQLLVRAQRAEGLPHPLAHDVPVQRLLGPGHGAVRQPGVCDRELPALPDPHQADVAQDRMQPRPRGPGLAQPAQPQQRDDERVLHRVGRIHDGKIAEAWEVYDEAGMWRQLGVAPPG